MLRSPGSQRMLALVMSMEEEGDSEIEVLARIKIHKPQVRAAAVLRGLPDVAQVAGIGAARVGLARGIL